MYALGCEPAYEVQFKRLEATLKQRPRARDLTVELKPFPLPEDDPLPYEQFLLLGGTRRYVVKDGPETRPYLPLFFAELWKKTEGVPSRLTSDSDEVHAFVKGWADTPLLADATDEDELMIEADRGT